MTDADRDATIVLVGTGRLATAVAHALALLADGPARLRLVVAGRDRARVDWLAAATAARACAAGRSVATRGALLDWDDPGALVEILATARPDLVVQFASLQSPWTVSGEDGWSRFVREGGYGVTAPFHLALLLRTLDAAARAGTAAPVVNACFPDFVNGLAARLGRPVACGIGNIGILAAFVGTRLGPEADLRLLANHSHVADCIRGTFDPARAPILYAGGVRIPVPEVAQLLPRLPAGSELNAVTGATAAPVLLALAGALPEQRCHVPAPHGLPGGYPVRIARGAIALDLPPDLTPDAAAAWNAQTARADGVTLEDGRIRFLGPAAEALRRIGEPTEYDAADHAALIDRFVQLRARLAAS